jgi:hypothetical protein
LSISWLIRVTYIVAASLTLGIGCRFYRVADTATRILLLLLLLSVVDEIVGHYMAIVYHNSVPIGRAYFMAEIFCYGIYFNYSVASLRRWHIGWFVSFAGVAWAIFCFTHFSRRAAHSYFVLAEGAFSLLDCAWDNLLLEPELHGHYRRE